MAAKDGPGGHASVLDRDSNPQQIGQVPLDARKANRIAEQLINELVRCLPDNAIEFQPLDAMDAGYQLDSKEIGQTKNDLTLRVGVPMEGWAATTSKLGSTLRNKPSKPTPSNFSAVSASGLRGSVNPHPPTPAGPSSTARQP